MFKLSDEMITVNSELEPVSEATEDDLPDVDFFKATWTDMGT